MKRIIISILLIFTTVSINSKMILLNYKLETLRDYNVAVAEYKILETISDSTFNSLFYGDSCLGLLLDYDIYGINEIRVPYYTTLSVKETHDICIALLGQNKYPWIWGGFNDLEKIPYTKKQYAQTFERRDPVLNNTYSAGYLYGRDFVKPQLEKYHGSPFGNGHKCILNSDKQPSRKQLLKDIEDYINVFLEEHKEDINKYGIEEGEYNTFFSKAFLDQYNKRSNKMKSIIVPLHNKSSYDKIFYDKKNNGSMSTNEPSLEPLK